MIVVRIEPLVGSARPDVAFEEFDGLLRIVFNRKNKTLNAAFGVREVLTMCERNYKVYCGLNGIPIDESVVSRTAAGGEIDVDMEADEEEEDDEEEAGEEEAMDEDEDDEMPAFFKENKEDKDAIAKTPSRNPKSKVALIVKVKVNKVLMRTGLGDKRARQCDQNDFLKLLLGKFLDLRICFKGSVLTFNYSFPRGGYSFLINLSRL